MVDMDIQTALEQVTSQMIARLDPSVREPEEYQEDCNILAEFNKIAAGMLVQEPGIEMPGARQPIPMDEKMVIQALMLFCEGIFYTIEKCFEMGITGDLKKNLLQTVAMEIYNQSKQIVAATFGQEHTPDFQFTHEQQVEIIHKATEGHMVAYITEYESINGPLEPPQPKPSKQPPPQPAAAQAPAAPVAQAPAQTAEPPAQQAAAKQSINETSHDKYGAVALLLTTLPPSQRTRILKGFSAEEKELIEYYSYPQHLEQNLDLACVEAHLKKFRELLLRENSRLRAPSHQGISRLIESYPAEKLLSCVKDERPLVRRYLESRLTGLSGKAQAKAMPEPLPPRIEDILYKYLTRRLEPS